MIRYRTESFSGLMERDAAKVMAWETFEMGNIDILDTLEKGVLKDSQELRDRCFDFIDELNNNGFVDDFSFDDGVTFFEEVLKEIKKVTGYDIKYALWLADLDTVKDYYGRDMESEMDIDAYEIGPVVLSELGYDGTLYGYVNYPVQVMTQELNKKVQQEFLLEPSSSDLNSRIIQAEATIHNNLSKPLKEGHKEHSL